MKLQILLEESSKVSNVTLACGDGLLASHKIVVVGVSSFIKNILASIPVGDNVTLMLPDFTQAEVDAFLRSVTSQEEPSHCELSAALGRNIHVPLTDGMKQENLWEKVEQNMKIEFDETEEHDDDAFDYSCSNDKTPTIKPKKSNKKKYESNTEETKSKKNVKKKTQKMNCPCNEETKIDFAAHAKAFDIDVEKNIRELEQDFIINPLSKYQEKLNELVRKRIKFQQAMGSLIRGESETYKAAAEKYGVNHATLHVLFNSGGKNYQGRGSNLKGFTSEEERRIAARILERNNGGENLTNRILREVLYEEVLLHKVNFPDNERLKKLAMNDKESWHHFLKNFAKRNGLEGFIKATNMKKKQCNKLHCDICGSTFTYKNSLSYHRKTIHFL